MKETIKIKIEVSCGKFGGENYLADQRTFLVEASRGAIVAKLDDICTDIDASFEQ